MPSLLDRADQYIQLNLLECGREKCIPEKKFSFTIKNYHLFHYVLAGQGYLYMNGRKYHLRKGAMFYIPPNIQPHYHPSQEDPWTYLWLGFSGTSADKYLDECQLSIDRPIINDCPDNCLRTILENLYANYQEAGYLDLRCLGLAYQLFGSMLSIYASEKPIHLSSKERTVKMAKEFIANNYQFAITVVDIANSLGYTPNYLANVFSDVLNISPKMYLTSLRMEKAALLLKSSDYKIKDIGSMVGYKNQLHFSTEFKKHYGLSPITYKTDQIIKEETC